MKRVAFLFVVSGMAVSLSCLCPSAYAGYVFDKPHLPIASQSASYSETSTLENGQPTYTPTDHNPSGAQVSLQYWTWSWTPDPDDPVPPYPEIDAQILFTYSSSLSANPDSGQGCSARSDVTYKAPDGADKSLDLGMESRSGYYLRNNYQGGGSGSPSFNGSYSKEVIVPGSRQGYVAVGHQMILNCQATTGLLFKTSEAHASGAIIASNEAIH